MLLQAAIAFFYAHATSEGDIQTRTMTHATLFRSLRFAVLGSVLIVFPAGCGVFGGKPVSAVEQDALYGGPPAQIVQMQGRHIAVFTAPTTGWSVAFESTAPAYRERHVFVTLRQPDPSLMVAQSTVEHRVDTSVSLDETITVFARIVTHDGDAELSPYRPAVIAHGAR